MNQSAFDKYRDAGLLALRVGLGVMFIYHGAPKMFGGPESWLKLGTAIGYFGIHFFPVFWGFMAAFAEFGGGILLIGGFLLRPVCVLLTIDMIVAAASHFGAHQGLSHASHAIEDGIVFLSLILIGPGTLSLDALISRKRVSAKDK